MDIAAMFQNAFGTLNIWQIVSGILAGVIISKLLDEIFIQLFSRFWPEKYVEMLYTWTRQFDDKIDALKEKYPKLGAALETRIASVLDKMENIILDKE